MENQRFLFFRGSTPTLELVLPLAVDQNDTVFLTFRQEGLPVLEYAMNGSTTLPGGGSLRRAEDQQNVLLLTMTQADTLLLKSGEAELQLRLKNTAGADSFRPLWGRVGPAFKEGVIG